MSEEVRAKARDDESRAAATTRPSTEQGDTETVAPAAAPINGAPDAVTAALTYLRRGFSIFPLRPRSKQPAVKIARFLSGEQRMSEDEAREFWTANPEAGIAIVMGAPSGLVAIDCDVRNGADLEAARRDCPTGLIARTGGGGLHLFVRHPGGHVPKGKTARPGVDRQADGSYVVAAPSIHPSGTRYEWESFGGPGELPAWAIEKPVPPAALPQGEPNEPWVANTLAHPEQCERGTQDETLTRLAWWAAGSLDQDIAESILTTWALALWPGNERDPWTPQHVKAKLTSAYEKRAREFVVEGGAGGSMEAAKRPVFSVVSLRDLNAKLSALEYLLRPVWLCEGWVGLGPNLIAGPSHVGKTWLLLDLAVSVSTGRPFLGRYPVERGPVIYVAAEDGEQMLRDRTLAVWAGKIEQEHRTAIRTLQEAASQLEKMSAFPEGGLPGVLNTLSCALSQVQLSTNAATPAGLAQDIRTAIAAEAGMLSSPSEDAQVLVDLRQFGPIPDNLFFYTGGGFRFGSEEWERAFLAAAQAIRPRLVVFDPLKDLVSGKISANWMVEAVEYVSMFRRLRDEFQCASVVVHHSGKDSTRRGTDAAVNANSLFTASFDSRWIIAEAGDRSGVITRRSKLGPPQPRMAYTYTVEPEEDCPTGYVFFELEEMSEREAYERTRPLSERMEVEAQADSRAETIWQVLRDHGPLSETKIEQQLRARHVPIRSGTVGQYLKQLEQGGRVEQEGATRRGGARPWRAVGTSPQASSPAPLETRGEG